MQHSWRVVIYVSALRDSGGEVSHDQHKASVRLGLRGKKRIRAATEQSVAETVVSRNVLRVRAEGFNSSPGVGRRRGQRRGGCHLKNISIVFILRIVS